MGEPLEPLFQDERDLSEAKVGGREGGREVDIATCIVVIVP